jgi:hypothetical protein
MCSLCREEEGGKTIHISLHFINFWDKNQNAAGYFFRSFNKLKLVSGDWDV